MKLQWLGILLLQAALPAFAGAPTDFSGAWEFNVAKSQNIGMMAQMKMTVTIHQSDSALDLDSHSTLQGQDYDAKTHFDLAGKPVSNEAPMSGMNETVSKWDGKKLVTTWTGQGAVAGSKIVRTETRWLSADGKTMTVESARGNNPPLVMVFEKKQ